MARVLVSYDDISSQQGPEFRAITDILSHQSPSKKRKRTSQKSTSQRLTDIQHWDDPERPEEFMVYDEDEVGGAQDLEGENNQEKNESRELTHDEIWDDSALIDAWNSATAEYEAFHGPDKNWKNEAVKSSPLWNNTPCNHSDRSDKGNSKKKSFTESDTPVVAIDRPDTGADSRPLDFQTFVPTHDPALASLHVPSGVSDHDSTAQFLPGPPGPLVCQDEAFTRALGAMYWAGYWTAAYHYQRDSVSGTSSHSSSQDPMQDEDSVPRQQEMFF